MTSGDPGESLLLAGSSSPALLRERAMPGRLMLDAALFYRTLLLYQRLRSST
ncbi:MAG: hypothetical protein ACREMG_01835 [Gemmatimonadales bacterium]